jgi:hypothetical protein
LHGFARSKHIIHPAHFENQNLTNTQGEYLIEKSLTRMHNKLAQCTLTGFILAIDKKKSDTTCSPPWKQKERGNFAINISSAFCTLDAPSK